MSELSKAERYRQAHIAADAIYPVGCEIIEMGQVVLTATVTETGKVKIATVPGISISPDKITQVFFPWFRDTCEPPNDEVAEIVKGLRVLDQGEHIPRIIAKPEQSCMTCRGDGLNEIGGICGSCKGSGVQQITASPPIEMPEVELTEEEAVNFWTKIYDAGDSRWHLVMLQEVYRAGAAAMWEKVGGGQQHAS